MSPNQFEQLSTDLRNLAKVIPLHWGHIQNNGYDRLIDMFSCGTYRELEAAISTLSDEIKSYFRRRWYLWQCAQCDEYLFCENTGVTHNPNPRDQSYDIDIFGRYRFDIKGTVIPREMRSNVESLLQDPSPMVQFFYDRQSRGVRYNNQNRLFIVHHSFVSQEREFFLRCAWGTKRNGYAEFIKTIDTIKFVQYANCDAGVIFVLESERGKAKCIIAGK